MTDSPSVREEIIQRYIQETRYHQACAPSLAMRDLALRLVERVERLEAHTGANIIRNLQQSVRLLTEERDEARRERDALRRIAEHLGMEKP